MTLEEKRQAIMDHCSATHCDNCKLYKTIPFSENCYSEGANIERNYEIIFGKTEEDSLPENERIKKFNRVIEYCNNTECDECLLCRTDWEHTKHNATNTPCLYIQEASDDELDRAIKIIEGKIDDEPIEVPGVEEQTVEVLEDPVNRPAHYTKGGIECIEAIKASMSAEEYAGFLKGQIIKYVWRYRHKGKPVEDLKKANFYLDRLIRETEGEVVKS